MTKTEALQALREDVRDLRRRLRNRERQLDQLLDRAEAAEARVAGLERERDAACEAVGAIGAAATEAEDRMYGRFRQAEIERDEARAKVALADRLAEAARPVADLSVRLGGALAAYDAAREGESE